jgi:hypothetical protein
MEGTDMTKIGTTPLLPTPTMKEGDRFKITGGKYKKFGSCVLKTKNATYSDCELPLEKCEEHSQINRVVKIKNDYLLSEQPFLVEMPDAEDLEVVEDISKYEKEPEDIIKEILDTEKVDGELEISDTGEVVDNVSERLPSVDEALALRNEVEGLRKDVLMLNQELNLKHREVQIAMEEKLLLTKKFQFLKDWLEKF